jgi:hypothetical protein
MGIFHQLSRSKLEARTNAFRPSLILKQAASRERGRFLAHVNKQLLVIRFQVEEHAILLVSDYRVTVAHWIGGLRYK